MSVPNPDWDIQLHNFTVVLSAESDENLLVNIDVIHMSGQHWIWMGTEPKMNNLHLAMETFAGITSTKLLGSTDDTIGGALASRLAKQLSSQVFLSYQLPPLTQLAEAQLQKKLSAELLNIYGQV